MEVLLLRSSLWSSLPEELVMEVFSRLPDKKLLGLRRVSKKYCSLISKSLCPRLAASAHISGFVFQWKPSNMKRRFNTLTMEDDIEWNYSYVTPTHIFSPFGGELVNSYLSLLPFRPKRRDFLGCYNGFFLVRKSSVANSQYFVCNPVTRQCVAIPVNPMQNPEDRDRFVGLAFDPMFDTQQQEEKDFKIVRITRDNERPLYPFRIDIFSSTMDRWKSYPLALEAKTNVLSKRFKDSVYADGVFYMLSLNRRIVCLDLLAMNNNNSNIFIKARVIKLPHTSNDGPVGLFASSKGCLYYACITRSDLLVWIFQSTESESLWIPKHSISFRDFRPMGTIIAVDLSAEIIYFRSARFISSYDIKSKQFKGRWLEIEGVKSMASTCFWAYSCCLLKLTNHFSGGKF